jgi:hypothetical protein
MTKRSLLYLNTSLTSYILPFAFLANFFLFLLAVVVGGAAGVRGGLSGGHRVMIRRMKSIVTTLGARPI